MTAPRSLLALTILPLLVGCDIGKTSDHPGGSSSAGSGSSAASSGGQGGSSSTGGGVSSRSDLPVPPGPSDVPKPSGAPGGLKILPWAGFKAAVSYTFDDAQPSQVEHWKELADTGIRGTMYLNTLNQSWVPSFDATWKDAAMKGWELGNHTVHHCNANGTCSNGATFTTIDEELDGVTTYIKTTTSQPDVYTAAYPFGDTGYEDAAKSRFFLARGVYEGTVDADAATDPYNLPCVAAIAAGGEPASKFSGDIDTAISAGTWLVFLFHSIGPTTQAWYATTDIGSITGSIDHAKSQADLWADPVSRVGAYWLGRQILAKTMPVEGGGATTWTWTVPAHFPPKSFLRVTVTGGSLTQGKDAVPWDPHGYYEISLDAGSLTISP